VRRPPPIALTLGDPAGIGPEIALAAWNLLRHDPALCFFMLADPRHLETCSRALARAGSLPGETPLAVIERVEDASTVFADALPVLPLNNTVRAVPGQPSTADAPAVIESIERAVALARAGEAACVATNPIAKHVLYDAGFRHPGHTEFLAALSADADNATPPHPVMMLWSEGLAVVPVTVHIPLAQVPEKLTRDLIVETGRIVARDLRTRFSIAAPRLALAGLNPHAGESGTMGREEIDVIAPAIAQLQAEGIDARGPFPGDTLFHARARAGYDAVLCMYHDQALIPIKTIAFDDAVNVTLGLPFLRVSPDHGTAFDIAGKGVARPDSLVAALRLGARLVAGKA
jgi:4-hydroxythreonine-4-phosphate dehydrogenase